jgi:hypothetical protein
VWIADQYRVLTAEEYLFDVRVFIPVFLCSFNLKLHGHGILGRPFVSDSIDMPTITRLIGRCS